MKSLKKSIALSLATTMFLGGVSLPVSASGGKTAGFIPGAYGMQKIPDDPEAAFLSAVKDPSNTILAQRLLMFNAGLKNSEDADGNTALMLAASTNNYDLVATLLQMEADDTETNKYGKTALDVSIEYGYENIAKLILDTRKERGKTVDLNAPLITAVQQNRASIVAMLLEFGASPDAVDRNGNTALLIAIKYGNPILVDLLLKSGANPNVSDDKGSPALLIAIKHSNPSLVELLINHGANPNVEDGFGNSGLRIAMYSNNDAIISALLKSDKVTFDKDAGSKNSLCYMLRYSVLANRDNILKQLINYASRNGLLIDKLRDFIDSVLLYEAAQYGYVDVLRVLIPMVKDHSHIYGAMERAFQYGMTDAREFLRTLA